MEVKQLYEALVARRRLQQTAHDADSAAARATEREDSLKRKLREVKQAHTRAAKELKAKTARSTQVQNARSFGMYLMTGVVRGKAFHDTHIRTHRAHTQIAQVAHNLSIAEAKARETEARFADAKLSSAEKADDPVAVADPEKAKEWTLKMIEVQFAMQAGNIEDALRLDAEIAKKLSDDRHCNGDSKVLGMIMEGMEACPSVSVACLMDEPSPKPTITAAEVDAVLEWVRPLVQLTHTILLCACVRVRACECARVNARVRAYQCVRARARGVCVHVSCTNLSVCVLSCHLLVCERSTCTRVRRLSPTRVPIIRLTSAHH